MTWSVVIFASNHSKNTDPYKLMFTLPTPCISESYIKIKINLSFYLNHLRHHKEVWKLSYFCLRPGSGREGLSTLVEKSYQNIWLRFSEKVSLYFRYTFLNERLRGLYMHVTVMLMARLHSTFCYTFRTWIRLSVIASFVWLALATVTLCKTLCHTLTGNRTQVPFNLPSSLWIIFPNLLSPSIDGAASIFCSKTFLSGTSILGKACCVVTEAIGDAVDCNNDWRDGFWDCCELFEVCFCEVIAEVW